MGIDITGRVAGLKNYSYVNARVRAMRGDLITDPEYRKLGKMELAEIAEFMGNRGYDREIEEFGGDLAGDELVERAVQQNLVRTYQKLTDISPDAIRRLLWLYFRKFDIHNMKVVLRRAARDADDVSGMLLPTRELDRETLDRYLGMDDMERILDAFAVDGFDGDVLDRVDDPSDLQQVEDALDIYYYTNLVTKVDAVGSNSRLFQRFLELEAALKNVSLILRMRRRGDYTYEDIVDRLIPVPDRQQVVDEEELARMDSMDEIIAHLRDSRVGAHLEEDADSLAQVERALEKYKLKQGIRMMHTDQLGVNPVLGYMVCKEVEAGNLRMIARAKAEGLGEAFIERNLVGGVAR